MANNGVIPRVLRLFGHPHAGLGGRPHLVGERGARLGLAAGLAPIGGL